MDVDDVVSIVRGPNSLCQIQDHALEVMARRVSARPARCCALTQARRFWRFCCVTVWTVRHGVAEGPALWLGAATLTL